MLVSTDLYLQALGLHHLYFGFDGLVLVTNCDKIIPGMIMAALRLNIPSILISGGPMLAGRFKGRFIDLSTCFEAVGSYSTGKYSDGDIEELENEIENFGLAVVVLLPFHFGLRMRVLFAGSKWGGRLRSHH